MLMHTFKGLETDHGVGLVTLIIALKTKVKSTVMQSRSVLKNYFGFAVGSFFSECNHTVNTKKLTTLQQLNKNLMTISIHTSFGAENPFLFSVLQRKRSFAINFVLACSQLINDGSNYQTLYPMRKNASSTFLLTFLRNSCHIYYIRK